MLLPIAEHARAQLSPRPGRGGARVQGGPGGRQRRPLRGPLGCHDPGYRLKCVPTCVLSLCVYSRMRLSVMVFFCPTLSLFVSMCGWDFCMCLRDARCLGFLQQAPILRPGAHSHAYTCTFPCARSHTHGIAPFVPLQHARPCGLSGRCTTGR